MEKSLNTKSPFSSSFIKTAAALVAANFFFGTNIIAVKKISPIYIAPVSLGYLRMLFATAVFFILSCFYKPQEKIKKEDYLTIFFAAITGISLNQILSINGIAQTNPLHASLLNMATPIFVSILSAFILKDRFGWNKLVGLTLGISGAWLMIFSGNQRGSQHLVTLIGDFMVLLAALCYSSYLIVIKKITGKYHFITILKYIFLTGALISTPYCIGDFLKIKWMLIPQTSYLWLFHILFFATFLAYLLINWGVQQWGPAKTGSFVYLQPFFGTLASIIILNEEPTALKIMAGSLIIAGTWLNSLQHGKQLNQ